MRDSICHVEIPADNLESLQKFYGGVFEWDFDRIPGDGGHYGIKHGDEKLGAGMMARQDQKLSHASRYPSRHMQLDPIWQQPGTSSFGHLSHR